MSTSYFNTALNIPSAASATPSPFLCPSDVPVLLLPVRLETRFFPAANGSAELRIRVYPDKLQINSHEAALLQSEIDAGRAYWREDWCCGEDTARRKQAWSTLADRFGAERAAWLAQTLRPTNAAQRPSAATAPGQTSNPAPSFAPAPAPIDESWRQAAQASLMPDRWIACVHSSGGVLQVVPGRPIGSPIQVGPNPSAAAPNQTTEPAVLAGEDVAVDPGMRWMVDFDKAEELGMALRVVLPPSALTAGLDVVVFGVGQALTPAQASAGVADLLDGHHYTDGLGFLQPGTRTNNTEQQRSDYRSRDTEHDKSFAAEVLNGTTELQATANATTLGRVLGLDTVRAQQTLGRLPQSRGTHDLDQRSMNTALWQFGWGYFLGNMVESKLDANAGLSEADLDWVRSHFIGHVRAGGLLAPIRAGRQPYGILPVASIDTWASAPGADDQAMELRLRDLLVALREQVWRPALSHAARIGLRHSPADPDADFAEVMSMDAVSHGLHTRAALGRSFAEHLQLMTHQDGEDRPGPVDIQQRLQTLLTRLGLTSSTDRFRRLASLWFEDKTRAVSAPLVQQASAAAALQPNYIAAMLDDRRVQTLLDARPTAQTSVLQALLRHAALREIASAAAHIAASLPGLDLRALLRERELIDLVDQAPVDFVFGPPAKNEHWRRQLQRVVPAITGTSTIQSHLETLQNHDHPAVRPLGEFYAALEHLKSQPADALEILLQSTLDLGSHRLDAWITSFANKRLGSMSQAGLGLRVGSYGWVENLQLRSPGPLIVQGALPVGEPEPLRALPNDSGFIHAPSLTHASAAALLRNAHLGPTGVPAAGDPFAIDLSSRRARKAAQFLRGVQRGQPLGALLGYDFERRLHELGLDKFIQAFRALSPQTPIRPTGQGVDRPDTQGVVDGLALLQRYEDETDTAVDNIIATGSPEQRGQLVLGFASLRDAVDGLADAMTAETAFQVARGNASRMASTLEAISRGESNPGRLEVLQTPRTGASATHRVLCLMSGGPQTAPGWAATDTSAAASVERMLNAWVSRLLRDPRQTRITAASVDTGTGQIVATRAFALSELGLTALDFVLGVQARAGDGDTASRVERLAEYHAERLAGSVAASTRMQLSHARPSDLGPSEVALSDMLEQACSIRRLLLGARPVRPQDLLSEPAAASAGIDFVDLDARVRAAENALVAARKRLTDLIAPGATPTCENLRAAILSVGAFALSQSVPGSALGESPAALDTLRAQTKTLSDECSVRVDTGAALRSQPAPADALARLQRLSERAKAALGPSFLLLPKISLDAAAALEWQNALSAPALLAADLLAPYTWFTRHARVREPVAALAACMRQGDVFAVAERLTLRVAQLPYGAGEPWIGLPLAADAKLPDDKLSLMIQSTPGIVTTQPLCGLWVDEWVEITPSASETTAVAFQYDPPNAMAPQCALLAVPSVPGQDWTVESMRRVLLETLDLAKLRAIDPSLLGAVAQYLPASYAALNAADDAVSTDLAQLTS